MRSTHLAILGTVLACGLSAASADEPAADAPRVVSLMHYIHATQNVDDTTAFYRDVFRLETPPVRFYEGPGAARLNNAPDLVLRLSRPILPGEKYGFEFTEFTHVDRKGGQQALPTDPGAVELILHVRDLDPVYAAARERGAEILSRGGLVKIDTSMGPTRALLIRDPDGYLVRTIEVPASKAMLSGNIQAGASLGVAVADLDKTVAFYRDVLGFEVTGGGSFASNPAMADLVGALAGSEYRSAAATFPGESNARIEFYDWKGMPRTPFSLRVPDPGAGGMVMEVENLDAIVEKVKALGLATVTPEPIWFTSTIRDIFVKDLDGLNLELYEQVPAGEGN